MRIWLAVGLALVIGVAGLFEVQEMRHRKELRRQEGAYKALQEELARTRTNVLKAAKNAAESRTELSTALQTEEEWSATKVPDSIRRSLSSDRMRP